MCAVAVAKSSFIGSICLDGSRIGGIFLTDLDELADFAGFDVAVIGDVVVQLSTVTSIVANRSEMSLSFNRLDRRQQRAFSVRGWSFSRKSAITQMCLISLIIFSITSLTSTIVADTVTPRFNHLYMFALHSMIFSRKVGFKDSMSEGDNFRVERRTAGAFAIEGFGAR